MELYYLKTHCLDKDDTTERAKEELSRFLNSKKIDVFITTSEKIDKIRMSNDHRFKKKLEVYESYFTKPLDYSTILLLELPIEEENLCRPKLEKIVNLWGFEAI